MCEKNTKLAFYCKHNNCKYNNFMKIWEQNKKGENDDGNTDKAGGENLVKDNLESKKNKFMFINYKRN
ncbi:MAG: hypothetical protein II037_12675, partial [Bacteroidales bacterium]|nr:hypothetical protein [Bacteroidales bacterium]